MSFAFSDRIADKAEDLGHAVVQIPEHDLIGAAGIVLRVGVGLWDLLERELDNSSTVSESLQNGIHKVVTRTPNASVFVILDGHSAAMKDTKFPLLPSPRQLIDGVKNGAFFQPVPGNVSEAIRAAEFGKVFEKGKARSVISSSANYHFSLPSGAHASQFIRLADSFSEMGMVDRVAYWLALEMQTQIVKPVQGTLPVEADDDETSKKISSAGEGKPHALI
ncbi:hypothetical protein Q9L58_010984, partial [Maublancomyces gigas]